MHSVLLSRGNKLFCEAYFDPYKSDDNHRMYSQTKSYVGIAVAQLAAEGKISLDDKIIDYFPEKLPKEVHPYLAAQTIRNMLNMQTCFTNDRWFLEHGGDRVKYYFSLTPTRYPGTTFNEMRKYVTELKLLTTRGAAVSPLAQKVNGKTFKAEENPMGISEFTINFNGNEGTFRYINAQGEKEIKFGMNENLLQLFPETGYSKDIGGERCEGHRYRCTASAGWVEDDKLSIFVQIIDDYIGILDITIGFNGDIAVVDMKSSAEYFLTEYDGYLTAK